MWLGASVACVGTYTDTLHQNVAFCLTAAWTKSLPVNDNVVMSAGKRSCPYPQKYQTRVCYGTAVQTTVLQQSSNYLYIYLQKIKKDYDY